jgi:hypothetical protein
MFTLRQNMLFFAERLRSFKVRRLLEHISYLCSVSDVVWTGKARRESTLQ